MTPYKKLICLSAALLILPALLLNGISIFICPHQGSVSFNEDCGMESSSECTAAKSCCSSNADQTSIAKTSSEAQLSSSCCTQTKFLSALNQPETSKLSSQIKKLSLSGFTAVAYATNTEQPHLGRIFLRGPPNPPPPFALENQFTCPINGRTLAIQICHWLI